MMRKALAALAALAMLPTTMLATTTLTESQGKDIIEDVTAKSCGNVGGPNKRKCKKNTKTKGADAAKATDALNEVVQKGFSYGNSVIDSATSSYEHTSEDYSAASSGSGCGPCGGTVAGDGLPSFEFNAIHKPRQVDTLVASYGPGVFSNYDLYLSLYDDGAGNPLIDVFVPENGNARQLSLDGTAFREVHYADFEKLELYDAAEAVTTDPLLAVTAKLFTRINNVISFEIFDNGALRSARLTAIKNKNGYGLDFTYEHAVGAAVTTAELWRKDTVTDAHNRTATYNYLAENTKGGHHVIESLDLPNATSVVYAYSTGTDGRLTGTTLPDGTSSSIAYGLSSTGHSTIDFDDAAASGIHKKKTVYFTAVADAVIANNSAYGVEIFPQAGMMVQMVVNGNGEVSYLHVGDKDAPATQGYVYEGSGKLKHYKGHRWSRHCTDWHFDLSQSGYDVVQVASMEENYAHMMPGVVPLWRIIKEIPKKFVNENGKTIRFEYTDGNLSKRIHPDQTYETYVYNVDRQVIRYRDRLGRITKYVYDARSNLLQTKVGLIDVGGVATQTVDFAIAVNQYYPTGHQNEHLLRYAFDYNGNRTEYLYDADNYLVNVIEPDDAGTGDHVAATYTYNTAGLTETVTDAVGRVTTLDYDDRNRLVKTTYHDTSTELTIYGIGSQANLVVKQKERNGNVTKFDYDNAGRRDQIITAYSTMDADGSNEVVNPASLQSVEDCIYVDGTSLKESCIRNGDLVEYDYDYRHRLDSTTRHPRSGVSLTDSRIYDKNWLFSTTDAYGRSTYHAYRAADSALIRTVKGTIPSFTLANYAAVEVLTRDLTSNANYLITDYILDEEGQRLGTVDPRGILHETDYDSRGRSTNNRVAVGTTVEAETVTQYDANSNVRFSTNARGFITEQTYTRRNLLESRTVALGTADQATESFTYFNDKRPDAHVDFRGNLTQRVWHQCCGRLQATVDQAGHGSISNNDYYGNVTHTASVEDVLSHAAAYHDPIDAKTLQEVTTRFDSRHRPIARTVWLTPLGYVDPNDAPIAGDPGYPAADGLTTTYEYFDEALTTEPKLTAPLAELTADGIDLDYVNNDGAAVLVTNPEGEQTLTITDGVGRSIASGSIGSNGTLVTWSTTEHDIVNVNTGYLRTRTIDALDHDVRTLVDGVGRTVRTVDAEVKTTDRDYDANGNVVSVRDPNGVGQDCIFDERNRDVSCLDTFGDLTSRTYDANNNVVTSTDAKLKVTTTVYDARDRRASVTDRLNGTTVYTYDDNSNLKTITDAETKVTTYTYDVRNLKTHTQYPDHLAGSVAGDADYGIEECSYDAMRRKEVCTDQLGDTVTCEYDMASRKLFRTYERAAQPGILESTDSFTYDGASRLLTADKGRYGNAIAYTYDEIGRRETESLTIDGQTYLASHVYDAANRITECTYPDGSVVTKEYTDRNQLELVKHSTVGVPPASGTLVAQFGYDNGMREISRLHGNGLIADSTYRLDNLKDSISVTDATTTLDDVSFSYGYDANKNVTSETTTGTVMAGNSYSATYDDQDRLASWTRTNAVDAQSWNLDLVGNWDGFTNNGTAQVRTYSDAHEVETIGSNGTLAHDSKGNLTTDANGQTYTWDIDNHLGSATVGTTLTNYEYDALGRRVSKEVDVGGTPVKTVYFSLAQAPSYGFTPGQVIAEYGGGVPASSPDRVFIYGTYIDEPLAKIESGSTLYYHCNRKFDVAGLTDALGNIVELYAYSPYGIQTVMDASGTDIGLSAQNNPYGFTGRRLDEETGLWYFRARYFDSELGRFISRDPIGYVDGKNRYQFVRSCPFVFVDPLGTLTKVISGSWVKKPKLPPKFPRKMTYTIELDYRCDHESKLVIESQMRISGDMTMKLPIVGWIDVPEKVGIGKDSITHFLSVKGYNERSKECPEGMKGEARKYFVHLAWESKRDVSDTDLIDAVKVPLPVDPPGGFPLPGDLIPIESPDDLVESGVQADTFIFFEISCCCKDDSKKKK